MMNIHCSILLLASLLLLQAVLKDILNVFLHQISLYPSMYLHPTFQQLVSVYLTLHCVMAQKNAPLALMKQNVKVKSMKAFL